MINTRECPFCFIASLILSPALSGHLRGMLLYPLEKIAIKHAFYALALGRISKLIPPPWSKVGRRLESFLWFHFIFLLRPKEINLHLVDSPEVWLTGDTISVHYDVISRQMTSFDPPSWIHHLLFHSVPKKTRNNGN